MPPTPPTLSESFAKRARTKIVATVGPACRQPGMLLKLIQSGVDVFRLNMAHGTPADHEPAIHDIRSISHQVKRPTGILVDLAGPKIRLGQLLTDPVECREAARFRFVRGDVARQADELTSTYATLVDELDVDDRVLLADGTVSMVVTAKIKDEAHCQVNGPGTIRSRQGINLPGVKLSVPALGELDTAHAKWASRAGADFISLSFVRSATEIGQLRDIVRAEGSRALIIAKIEKPDALEHLDEIVEASDGIMVARGDLGVEIDVAEIPFEQKRIIDACRRFKRPVIVATQMLDSMHRSSRPTRAEVTDVANAILDGADACMLSGETAIGNYPRESVEMMNRIMLSSERMMAQDWRPTSYDAKHEQVHPITSAVVYGSGRIAAHLNAKMVVIATRSGATALAKAKLRDFIPTVAVSDSEETLRQVTLFWGIDPIEGTPKKINEELLEFISDWGRRNGSLQTGDRIVIVTGSGLQPVAHNLVMVHEVE